MSTLPPRLQRLGDDLERAAQTDLDASAPAPVRRRRRIPRPVLVVGVVLAVAIPSVAIAADRLFGPEDVAKSLPAGTLALAGTHPSCTEVRAGVEYHCTLRRAPAPEVSDWAGTVEPTVDATKHVNGGCRSLNSEGTEWQCYLGTAAVDQRIIGAGFLHEYAPSPGQG